MCGIAGYVGELDPARAEACVRTMTASQKRRGPDDQGVESWPGRAVLGHTRLAVFDLSHAGHQPMLSADRSTGIVFNGAIYNFRELRTELDERGFTFHSQTDTEVLLHGYRCWGIEGTVSRLRGMFAFALWDDRRRELFLVRDRMGAKPLVYAAMGGTIAFASSVEALRKAGVTHALDDQAVLEYLEFGYVTDARTIYAGACKLPAASILHWKDGAFRQYAYWAPPPVRASHSITFEDAVVETERLFLRAVELRLSADVPVGALLSGGIDSSLVCWATQKLGGNIRAFTVGTPGDPGDETADAIATAQTLGISHQTIPIASDDIPSVDELLSAYGEPFACTSALGMLRVSKAVKPLATVLLTGDGGDDVFLGYPEHKHFWMAQRFARFVPAVNPWTALRRALPDAGWLGRGKHFLDYATGGLGAVTRVHNGLPVYARAGILGERLNARTLPDRELPLSASSARNLLPEFLAYDRNTRFPGEYMTKVDGATMHYSLEARSPFLDHKLWEFASTLPFEIRMRGGKTKAILREIARRHIGERVASGVKRGFHIPVRRCPAGPWPRLEREGYIRPGAAHDLPRDSKQLWYLFVLENWLARR